MMNSFFTINRFYNVYYLLRIYLITNAVIIYIQSYANNLLSNRGKVTIYHM